MAPWARYLATGLAFAGIAVCVFFLFHAAPIAIGWFGMLVGDDAAPPRHQALATFIGVASTLGSLVLLFGLLLILWLLKRLWLPPRE